MSLCLVFSCLYFLVLQTRPQSLGTFVASQQLCNGITISCSTSADGAKLYGCPIPGCSKTYNTIAGCRQHMDNVHVNGGQHRCTFCPKILSSKSSLRNHKIILHNANSHLRCPHCNKAFLDKPRLDTHAAVCGQPVYSVPHLSTNRPSQSQQKQSVKHNVPSDNQPFYLNPHQHEQPCLYHPAVSRHITQHLEQPQHTQSLE